MSQQSISDYQKFIVDNKFDQAALDFSYIKEESKTKVEEAFKVIEDFIAAHTDFDNYTEDVKNTYFNELFEVHYVALKNTLKNETYYTFKTNGGEFNQAKYFIQEVCPYDAGTVYYGIHLDSTLFKRYEKKIETNKVIDIELLSGESILMYELLCKKTMSGLGREAYMSAAMLRKLAECAKIYNHYDELTGKTFKKMQEWNMGLSIEKANEFKEKIAIKMAHETVADANS